MLMSAILCTYKHLTLFCLHFQTLRRHSIAHADYLNWDYLELSASDESDDYAHTHQQPTHRHRSHQHHPHSSSPSGEQVGRGRPRNRAPPPPPGQGGRRGRGRGRGVGREREREAEEMEAEAEKEAEDRPEVMYLHTCTYVSLLLYTLYRIGPFSEGNNFRRFHEFWYHPQK